jgi:hypothetical protein
MCGDDQAQVVVVVRMLLITHDGIFCVTIEQRTGVAALTVSLTLRPLGRTLSEPAILVRCLFR